MRAYRLSRCRSQRSKTAPRLLVAAHLPLPVFEGRDEDALGEIDLEDLLAVVGDNLARAGHDLPVAPALGPATGDALQACNHRIEGVGLHACLRLPRGAGKPNRPL